MGPRESPEKRGVDVEIQEDQIGKDVLNITHSLRVGPKRGTGKCTHGKRKWEEEVYIPAIIATGLSMGSSGSQLAPH